MQEISGVWDVWEILFDEMEIALYGGIEQQSLQKWELKLRS